MANFNLLYWPLETQRRQSMTDYDGRDKTITTERFDSQSGEWGEGSGYRSVWFRFHVSRQLHDKRSDGFSNLKITEKESW